MIIHLLNIIENGYTLNLTAMSTQRYVLGQEEYNGYSEFSGVCMTGGSMTKEGEMNNQPEFTGLGAKSNKFKGA